jgi:hypothetical protein
MALGAMFLRATSLSTTARLSNAEEPDSLRKISFCRVLPLWLHHDTLIHCRCIIKDFVHHKVSWTFNSLLRMHTNKHGACIQTSLPVTSIPVTNSRWRNKTGSQVFSGCGGMPVWVRGHRGSVRACRASASLCTEWLQSPARPVAMRDLFETLCTGATRYQGCSHARAREM